MTCLDQERSELCRDVKGVILYYITKNTKTILSCWSQLRYTSKQRFSLTLQIISATDPRLVQPLYDLLEFNKTFLYVCYCDLSLRTTLAVIPTTPYVL